MEGSHCNEVDHGYALDDDQEGDLGMDLGGGECDESDCHECSSEEELSWEEK